MVALMERWRMRDPALVYERIEAQERRRRAERSKEGKQEKAKRELEALFEREEDEAEHRDTAK